MTAKRVIGIDDKGNKLWERDAREYDSRGVMGQIIPGLTIGDIVKTIPIIFAIAASWINYQNQMTQQAATNVQMIQTLQKITEQVEKHSRILAHLDNYLSSSTGKQFNDGVPVNNIITTH